MERVGKAFAWFTIGVAFLLLLPRLAQDGMFMDGQLYSAVAHNQANGYGTFWQPRFSQVGVAGLSTFHEHPPLVFGMQAMWFKAFGSAFWVERSYSLLMAVATGWLLVLLWREWVPGGQGRRMAWWPVLLWIIVPTVFWCYHNNMMENTMGVFTTAAVLAVVKGGKGRWLAWSLLAGLCVCLASLSKGLPGLFPLGAPVLVRLVTRQGRWGTAWLMTLLMTGLVVLGYALLMAWPEAQTNLTLYVEKRLLHRIAVAPTVTYRLASLEMLFSNMVGPLLLALLVRLGTRRDPPAPASDMGRPALAMLLVGLSGVAPLMLTMVQKSFYMAAALPLVSLSIALWSAPRLQQLLERIALHPALVTTVRAVGAVSLVASLVATVLLFGTSGRDAELLRDVRRVGTVVPPHTRVGLPEDMWNDWSLQTYLMRYQFISLDSHHSGPEWFITASEGIPPDSAVWVRKELGMERIALWRKGR